MNFLKINVFVKKAFFYMHVQKNNCELVILKRKKKEKVIGNYVYFRFCCERLRLKPSNPMNPMPALPRSAIVPRAASGTTKNLRIISLSSWSKMWQCHTYPGPAVASNGNGDPSWVAKRILIVVTSPGFIWIVSFHHCSFAAGSIAEPVR